LFQGLSAYPPLSVIERIIVKEKRGNCVPVYVELPADLLTPCMAYLKIAKDSKYSFILESVLAGENMARYSFIGSGKLCSCSDTVYDLGTLQIRSRLSELAQAQTWKVIQ
jgi:anthranilate/para-aminobenzoate synthase component I